MKSRLLPTLFAFPLLAAAQTGPFPAPGSVALPLDEYNHLVDLAGKPVKRPDGPPAPYTLKSATLNFQAGAETVSGTIDLDGEVLAKGDTAVPLVTGMTIFDAARQGRELPIDQSGASTRAILPGPGEFSVSLRAGLPLKIEAGRAAFNLPVPAAGAVQLTLAIPGDRTSVNIEPGLITSRASSGGQTIIEATLAPGRPATIWWAARETVAPVAPREARFLSDVKTLVSISESAISLVALVDINVVQGDPARFEIEAPAGYGITGVTGPTLETSDLQAGVLTIVVSNAAQRSHQFLISMEKAIDKPQADVPFVTVRSAQRETGEVLVEGSGSLELAARESGALKRMDLKETSPFLRTLARDSITAAFRYHRQASDVPGLALEWVRFPESALPSAIAQSASVTTVVTTEGRSLTEVKLVVKNQSQPFLKVDLPPGATILSADVAGEKVKPAEGPDGQRVPLLRPGFRPTGDYTVSFVFLHAGSPFAKKGGSELALPKMDMPVGMVEWEVFLPAKFRVSDFGGNVIPSWIVPQSDVADEELRGVLPPSEPRSFVPASVMVNNDPRSSPISGAVTDVGGGFVPHAHVTVLNLATGYRELADTDLRGHWSVANFPPGVAQITVEAAGFKTNIQRMNHIANQAGLINARLDVGATAETVTVTASAATLETETAMVANVQAKKDLAPPPAAPPANILDLKQKVAGVLPIPIDVPRMGTSYRFVKPLVIDEEATVTFAYRTK